MCYNKETSLYAYIIGIVSSLVLFFYGDKYDKHIAFFVFIFIQIQLAEFFMWKDQECKKINHSATIFSHIILLLQPISVILGGLIFQTFSLPNFIVYIALFITLIPLIKAIITNIKNKRTLCSREVNKTGHLEWDLTSGDFDKWPSSNKAMYYTFLILFMFIPWLFLKNRIKGVLSFAIIFLSFLFSKIDTKDINLKFEQWESKWCFIAVIYPIIFLILKILPKKWKID